MSEIAPVEVVVQILQKHYRLQCMPEDVLSLQQSAKTLSGYMNDMRTSSAPTEVFSNEKLAIAVAVNLIGVIERHENEQREVAQRTDVLKDRILKFSKALS